MNCEWTVKSVYRDTFRKDISFWIYVNIRYENFRCSVIVDNMKEDCVLLEKLRKLQRVVHVSCALCALGFKKDGKVRKLERCITQRSIPVWVLTSRHTENEYRKTGNFRVVEFSRNFAASINPRKLKSAKYFPIFDKLVLMN